MPPSLTSRRQVGSTSLWLQPLGFGSAHISGQRARVTDADSRGALDAAWNGGIRYYDTAPFYGLGLSEHRLGDFLLNQNRADFVVTTKVGRVLHRPADPRTFDRGGWVGGLNFEIEFSYSYDAIMRAYEQSLMRLALDTVDALLIHDPDAEAHGDRRPALLDELASSGIKALEELKRAGDIKAIGMGLNTAPALETIAPLVDLDFMIVAMPYTLLDQTPLQTGLKRCVDNGISVIIGAPFASGILVTGPGPEARYAYGPANPAIQEKARRIAEVGAAHGVSLPAAALQFPLAHPAVVSVIPGGASAAEVTQNLASFRETIPSGYWSDLRAEGLIDPEAPTP